MNVNICVTYKVHALNTILYKVVQTSDTHIDMTNGDCYRLNLASQCSQIKKEIFSW